MTLPAFATLVEFAARIHGGIDDTDEPRAQAALDDASTLIRDAADKTWVTDDELDDPIPDVLRIVCLAAARRAFNNPDGIRSESAGSYSVSLADSSGDVYLTKKEEARVRAAAGKAGLGSIGLTTGIPSRLT